MGIGKYGFSMNYDWANKSAESERMSLVFPGVAAVKNSPE